MRRGISGLVLLLLCACGARAATMEQTWIERARAQNGPLFQFDGVQIEAGRRVWVYRMTIVETEHELANGVAYKVWAYGGVVPGPTLVVREQDVLRVSLTNETSVSHTIHSHGLFVPHRMDGVPHEHGAHGPTRSDAQLPAAIAPGETFTYEYIARPAGTHWYHCHVNTNEHLNRGMAGALVVLPERPEPPVHCDEALLLQEWNSRYARGGQPGNPRESQDADYFTINGRSFPGTSTVSVGIGQTCRLRIINAGMQFHSMHLHGHSFLVTHKDGAPIFEPLEMDTVPVGPGERVDLIVSGNNPGEWPLHCHNPTHQTNAGRYPGGMMMHMRVGSDPTPTNADGPIGPGVEGIREQWRRSAHRRAR